MAGFGDPEVLDLLREVWRHASYPVYQRVARRLAGLDAARLAAAAGRRRVRLALLSSFTVDPLVPYLQVSCLERDILSEVFVPGFNQYAQQILADDSALYGFRPDICFLHVHGGALVSGTTSGEIARADVQPAVDAVRGLASRFRERCAADLVVSNFAAPIRFPHALQSDESEDVYRELNTRLGQALRDVPGVHVLDFDRLTAFHGKSRTADERLRHLARMELGSALLPRLAMSMLAYVVALRGFARRCIVVDLDNTLWGGLVGESGAAGIELGPEYPGSAFVDFQRALLALQRRGVLLAINSKNNEADALSVLGEHPAMILGREHFAAMRINWNQKPDNIDSIAKELNLGLDSLVFIDDSPAERELMRRLRPDVLTPEWPDDPVLYRAALESLGDFATASVTGEDLRRAGMYEAEARRKEFKRGGATFEEFLYGLTMELYIHPAEPAELPRVGQLVQKTNQFNLTTRRYTAAELDALHRGKASTIYVLRNRDVFGDNGLVGVAIVVREAGPGGLPSWRIDSLLMSCRVLGRTIEQAFLHYLAGEARRAGMRYVIGEYFPTAKNGLVRDFYQAAGFRLLEESEHGARWLVDLDGYVPPAAPWLVINPEHATASTAAAAAVSGAVGAES